jgi:hypothetical protein
VAIQMDTVAASLEWRPGGRFAFQLGAGAVLDGSLNPDPGAAHDVQPGWIATLAGGWTPLPERGALPFVSTSISLGVAGATTVQTDGADSRSLLSMDARAAVVVGKSLFGALWTPYVVARGFSGPVFWTIDNEEQTGGDEHHFQIGIGSVLSCPRGFDLLVEWAPLGARGFTGGIGYAF